MRLLARVIGAIGLVPLIVAGLVVTPTVAFATSPVVGYAYVNDNTAGTNTIGGLAQHADGSLTALAGSPFSAGGAGTGMIVGSQGAIQVASHGRYVLAVDAGSNQISVLAVGSDGSLSLVGSPVSSGGIEPVSIAVHRRLVYVANEGDGTSGSNYTGFRLGSDGVLKPLSGSTVSLPATALPGDILFNGTGNNLIGDRGRDHRSQHVPDRQLPGPGQRTVGGGGRLAVPGGGSRSIRERILADGPEPPLRVERPRWNGERFRVRVLGEREREAGVPRGLAVSGRADRTVLGGDLTRRPIPVHREHRQHDDLELPHPGERFAPVPVEHAVQQWTRDPALRRQARRWWALPLRGGCRDRVDQRIRGERRFSEGAHVVADCASDRCDSLRHRHRGELRPIEGGRGQNARVPSP